MPPSLPSVPLLRVGLLAVALLLAGCGSGSGPAAAPTSPPVVADGTTVFAPPTATAPGPQVTLSPAGPPPPSAAPLPTAAPVVAGACLPAAVRVGVSLATGSPAGTRRAELRLTNVSGAACTLFGSVSVTLLGAAGKPLAVPSETVSEPGPAVQFSLPPGGSAFAGLVWTTCTGATGCPTGSALAVALPGAKIPSATRLTGFPAPPAGALAVRSFQVGTLQPVEKGVLGW